MVRKSREPQIRGYREYHLAQEKGSTAIYELVLRRSGRSFLEHEEGGEKISKNLLPRGGGETAAMSPKLQIYGNIFE
jgi:hypothetical protein